MWFIRYRGDGKVCFLPPPLLSYQICKIVRPMFLKEKARRMRKIFEVTFFKKMTFLGKFNGFLRFSVPLPRKKAAAGEK